MEALKTLLTVGLLMAVFCMTSCKTNRAEIIKDISASAIFSEKAPIESDTIIFPDDEDISATAVFSKKARTELNNVIFPDDEETLDEYLRIIYDGEIKFDMIDENFPDNTVVIVASCTYALSEDLTRISGEQGLIMHVLTVTGREFIRNRNEAVECGYVNYYDALFKFNEFLLSKIDLETIVKRGRWQVDPYTGKKYFAFAYALRSDDGFLRAGQILNIE